MGNAFTSMYSTLGQTNDANELRLLWEDFVTARADGMLQHPVRKEIIKSWKRCHDEGVNPRQTFAREGLTMTDLEQVQKESELFLVAKPIIDAFSDNLFGTGYMITLNDNKGRMLYLKGELDILKKTEHMNFRAGMDWSEEAAGTNAIGTSIITKMPIQIFATEHFCEGFQSMTCSSAPIYQPYTRKIIGVVDITGLWPNGHPHTLGMSIAIAQVIEQELAKAQLEKYNYLMDVYHQRKWRWGYDNLLVVSDDFLLVNGNRDLLKAFELNRMTNLQEHPDLRIITKALNKGYDKHANLSSALEKIELQGFRIHDIQNILLSDETIGYVILFRDQTSYTETVPSTRQFDLIGASSSFHQILNKAKKVAKTDAPVLLLGETGTGKEEITHLIHEESKRKEKPFIAMNCGAIQKELIASELFGYESGTFTGGNKEGKKGRFEDADGGTLFLDEIGEMPLEQQVLLLRAIDQKEITRLGSSKSVKVNVRIIAATNQDLQDLVEKGLFRIDLYYRLNIIPLEIPPLRARGEDIERLSNYFIARFAKKYEIDFPPKLAQETLQLLNHYRWPGNVRELRNVMEHAVVFSATENRIETTHLPNYIYKNMEYTQKDHTQKRLPLMDNLEKQQISELLKSHNGNLTAVSKELNMARSTLYRKIEKYEIVR